MIKTHKMSVHEGIKYQCDQCDYKATYNGNIKKHKMSVHQGIKYHFMLMKVSNINVINVTTNPRI